MDLLNEYRALKQELDTVLDDMESMIVILAENDSAYRVALATQMMKHYNQGVKAWTSCETLAKGNQHIADLRYQLTIVERKLDVKKERIMALKLTLRHLDAQIGREWNRGD